MPDLDDLLQEKLTALENGEPLESVLAGLPDEAGDLVPLLRLAASVNTLPQIDLTAEQSEAGRKRVIDATREITRPAYTLRPEATRPAPALNRAQPRRSLNWNNWRWVLIPGLGTLAALFLGAIILFGALAIWLAGPRGAHTAKLMDVSGQVEAASTDTANDWKLLENGDTVKMGQRLRTAGASSATLVFFEGTRSVIGSNADLTLNKVDGGWGDALRVLIYQRAGETANSVVPLKGKSSQFVVNTPSGSATVHGTRFNVNVGQMGETRFAVRSGKVLVSNEDSNVTVTAGQTTESIPGESLTAPAYQFSVQGELTGIDNNLWTVSGVQFTVNEQTEINGEFPVGAKVAVNGHIDADGGRVADEIDSAADPLPLSSFSGVVRSTGAESWQVGENTIYITPETKIDGTIQVGDAVLVTFQALADGRWQASSIQPLAEPPVTPAPDETATPAPNAKPDLEFQPDEIETTNCGNEFNLTGTLTNRGETEKDFAANVQLSYLTSRSGEYVESVEISPSSWPVIQAGASVSFNIHITMQDGWQRAQEDENEVKMQIYLASETNRPDHLKSRLTVNISCGEKQEKTPTPEPETTGTPQPSGTPGTSTPEVTPSPSGTRTSCTGANPQPKGMSLAQKYGVPYEEIMGWFCQGFGFGEIDLAYALSWQTGKPVEEIFAMKSGGMGWGEIKKQLQTGVGNPKHSVPHGPYGLNTQEPAVASTPEPPGNSGHPNKPGKPPKGP